MPTEIQIIQDAGPDCQFASIQIFDKAQQNKKIGFPFLMPFNGAEDDIEKVMSNIKEKLVSIQQNPDNNLGNMSLDDISIWTMSFQFEQCMIQNQVTQLSSYNWRTGALYYRLCPTNEFKMSQLRN